ncbi:hypothetical protein [Clostridium sp. C2-6-12]|uniref:hypothetical protein n=1 Tax=Clostridium sp. C2-6-12 TaxID=2698832 RepID=UPI00136BE8E0|nr:hypothetical protein [Clostridium sp. C2-6-12]
MKRNFIFIGIFSLLSFVIVITVFLYRQINMPYTEIIELTNVLYRNILECPYYMISE